MEKRSFLSRIGMWGLTLILIAYVVGPIAWMVDASFQARVELFSRPPTWLPSSLYLKNYIEVLGDLVLLKSLGNSFIVASFTTLISLTLGSLAAYAFARLRMPGKKSLFLAILTTQMLPGVVLLIPLYMIMRTFGLVGTYRGLILAYVGFSLPYVIWLLRPFFLSIPTEIEEAARIDGCSRLAAIIRIILPLSMPGFVSTGIFVFIGAWNEFIMATILTNSATKTFTVKVAQFATEESTAVEHMFAAAVIGSLPVMILALFLQRQIVEGLTEGGVK